MTQLDNLSLVQRFIRLPLAQRQAFLQKLHSKNMSFAALPIPAMRDEFEHIGLSYAQERQWFLWQLDPHSAAYHVPTALRLRGALDVPALQRSFDALLERHEVLRTVFVDGPEGPLQVAHACLSLPVTTVVLEAVPDAAALKALIDTEITALFDLQQGPLLRVKLLQLAPDDHVLVLTQHHIICDGASAQIMVHDLVKLYAAHSTGQAPDLQALPIQYADYAIWQRKWMEAGELARQLGYWTERLGDGGEVLPLPADRARPAVQSYRGARLDLAIDAGLTERLKRVAQREGCTLFMLLLASFQVLLHRYSGQSDIRVGVPVANRNRLETEGLIGFFVNTQVLDARIQGAMPFDQLLAQVKQASLGAQAHQDLPFEQLVQALAPDRHMSHSPLFQVMFNHQSGDAAQALQLPGLHVESLDWSSHTAQFDLTLGTHETQGALAATFTYATDLFDTGTIERLAAHWLNLLQGIVADPQRRIGELPLLDATEQQHNIAQWNPGPRSFPSDTCAHQLIAEQARQRPDAVALRCNGQTLTYAELNAQANRRAHQLIAHGVGPDVLVGLAAERGIEMIVGLLAILKAGGAYVPLDPTYPQDRLAYMMQDSGIQLLLAQASLAGQLPVPDGVKTLLLDTDVSAFADSDPQVVVDPSNLAYVIYTSGSTGNPKGTLLAHHNILRLFAATEPWFGFGPQDVWSLFHSYAFDFSVWEIFGALLHGGELLIVPYDVSRSPQEFLDLLCDAGVTVLNQTPSAFKQLMHVACADSRANALRYVVFGGEALDVKSLRPWFERFGDSAPQLINMYGITETTVHVTYRPLSVADLELDASSPIGEPIADLSWYLLDGELNPVAKGCIGELYVGRAGLARGYLKRGDLTALRFIPDPFGESGARLYRTGDLAQYRSDGVIEYIGRIDHQVKIRGFRIELGEIEARLNALAAVREAVVLAQEGLNGQQLVAYVIPAQGAEDAGALKAQLKADLPDYMVPTHLLFLNEWPLTANGKLDRKALPQPDASQVQHEYVAPQSALEQQIATVWQDVLKLERVGLTDNFFELGGHSLLATQMVSRIRQHLGMNLQLRKLFENASLKACVAALEPIQAAMPARIPRVPRDQPLPLSYAQQRQWFLWQMEPSSAAYHIPAALRIHGHLDLKALQRSLSALVQRHESLRTTFVQKDERAFQVIHAESGPLLTPQFLDLTSANQAEQIQAFVRDQISRPFDLQNGPLLRVGLLQVAADEQVLVLTQHHIVSDGWSMQVLVQELIERYAAYSQGGSVEPVELPIQYADYAVWQRQWMDAGERERQLAYWTNVLGAEQPLLELPADRPRPARQSFAGARLAVQLPQALGQQLRQLALGEGCSLFMLLLASFQGLLHRYSGQSDIRVGVPIANRNRVETEGLIGFFVNTQVLKAEVDPQQRFSELLQQVKTAALGAEAHQDLPFEQLVEALRPERNLSHSPLFQVLYNHQSAGRQAIPQLPGLVIKAQEWESRTAQFDLTLDTLDADGELNATLTYATDLFDASTAQRMAAHWLNLLQGIVADPQRRIGELPLLDATEQQHNIAQWNPGPRSFPSDTCAHQLIAEQARQRPDAVALRCNGQTLTYAELNAQANRRAHQLIAHGVGPDVLVGLAAERGIEMIVGLLAILKAGGAYVPLDPTYPQDRLAYMMQDSGIQLLLAQASLTGQLPVPDGVKTLLLDTDVSAFADSDPQVVVDPSNLAYVIYTSGSTGNPKGTLLAHHNILRLFAATEPWFGFGPQDVWSLFHSYAFDFSVWEIFGALLHGGELLIVPYDVSRSPQEFLDLLCDAGVTVLNQTPSAFKQLMHVACADSRANALRYVVFGGEALDVKSLRPWFERFGDSAPQLINMYGITETTVHVTYRPLSVADLELDASSPIGEPIADLSWYLLDGELNPVAKGCIGELYVGRAGLARGYLKRGDLTALRFIPDPFGESGARLYRTGDLAQYRSDGVIEYIGRIDHQVKIRGFRIELGEIEARLNALAAVREAVVLAQEGLNGQQLVAYVIPAQGAEDAGALKAQLKADLPDYMVPTHLLFLNEWPLTANGKLDRKALPQPNAGQVQHEYVAPQSALEQQIATVWQDVLKLERVGLTDNFFELGGDSIISIQVVSRARQSGIRFSPKDLFQHQTVQALATVAQTGDQLQVIDQAAVQGPALLLPIQQAYFADAIPQRHHYNQSVLLQPARALQAALVEQALQALVLHHDALRVMFNESAEGWSASHRDASMRNDLLWVRPVADAGALEVLANQAQRSLNLQTGPLLRAVLATLDDGTQRLLLVIHHLAVDGVSWRILFDDLQTAYNQLLAGQALQLPAKTSSVKAFAEQLQAHARSAQLQQQLAYWQAQLQGAPADLPCLNPEASPQNGQAVTVHTRLDKHLTRQLLQEAPAAYRTQVNDLLLTALARVVCRWTGHASTLIQLEGHGREELFANIDLTRTVGWFTSMFPVQLSPAAALGDSIKSIKQGLRLIPDKGVGFGALRFLGDEASRSALQALPVPRITFNYLGQFDASFDKEQGALFSPASESAGEEQSAMAPLGNWLSLNGRVFDGALSLGWTFSHQQFEQTTIQQLADDYAVELALLIGHCCDPANHGMTPSDFPLASFTQPQLDNLGLAARSVDDIYPLAPMQQGMLFHSLYEHGSGQYINQMCLNIDGLDPQRFEAAWQAAVDAHDILRSSFIWEGSEQPVQVVHKQVRVPFTALDWSTRTDAPQALVELASSERDQGFDLALAPLLRLVLVKTAEQRYHLIYTHHHILMDGWSNSQLLGEVLQRYDGQVLPRPAGRYRDYIAWLQGRDAKASETFWRAQLHALDAPTRLAENRFAAPQPAVETSHASLYHSLSQQQTQRLGEFARQQKVTLNTVVQAAWLLLLQHYTGHDTVAFGATVSGRPGELKGVEQQIGLFINTLPVIASPRPEQSVTSLLQQLQARNVALREHEHTPLFEIQRWAGQGGEGLFDTLLVFENYPLAEALQAQAPSGLSFGTVGNQEQTNFPLTLAVNLNETLSLHFTYAHAAFHTHTIQRLAEQVEHVLAQMVSLAADRSLGDIDLVGAATRTVLLRDWNATAVPATDPRHVHQWFESQARRTPDAPALLADQASLTYAQLNLRANRLAHALIERGVGPDVLVGLCMPRCVQMVVGLLAILKAGGAYVPLDPAYPQDRLMYMVEDSGIALLLTETSVQPYFADVAVDCLLLDALPERFDGYGEHEPSVTVDSQNLAYVIYTSGSTGKPKGVTIRHGALSNHMEWMQGCLKLDHSDRVLQKTAISFDASVWEFWLPLMSGAQLVLAAPQLNLDLTTLWVEVERWGISVLQMAPSLLQALLPLATREHLASLRLLLCGGEALSAHLSRQVLGLFDGELRNLYGPTEATIDTSSHAVAATVEDDGRIIAIGRPINNVSTYVLDGALQPCAVGAIGELYIGGESLARGYHQRPGLTAERFVPDPFGESAAARLYRTGDLVRHAENGVIEYIGRIDHQVKIRGLRIELGEIEARLHAQPEVRDAVVLARETATGTSLVGWLVSQDSSLDRAAEARLGEQLKARLAQQMPDFMVPTHLVFLDQLPLTPNGKLDRKALPAPDTRALHSAYLAPQSDLECKVAAIWQGVLNVEQVGLADDFFELGGHSLLVVNVVSRLQLELGMKLTPQLIFQFPVLGAFVAQLEQTGTSMSTSKLSKLEALLDEFEEV
ncbi:non-ribosomal peptide synthetase [Pseudomonas sp. GP01-A5]|uniref:non-ribosomal peptide synthetase n=1 Tax=Pseudomonas sp. GP01-A5 TaxID=2070563 RepID=UPI000C88BBEA|nr:non-ribosomal peptide synthetase [Pseudomonas sp. GP01-A5]PMU83333.1 non-ribosomal peptide synthetase [Pseudomonas sp. GP01-A5]